MQQTPFHAYYTARMLDAAIQDNDFAPVFASSGIEILTHSSFDHYHLQSLNIKKCQFAKLPRGICKLVNLISGLDNTFESVMMNLGFVYKKLIKSTSLDISISSKR